MQPGVLLPQSRSQHCPWGSPGGSFGLWVLPSRGICRQWLCVHTQHSLGRLAWSSALIASTVCKGGRDELYYIRDDTNVTIASICSSEIACVKCLLKHQGTSACPVLPALPLLGPVHGGRGAGTAQHQWPG